MQLNAGQLNAIDQVHQFLSNPSEVFMCISGPAGTGKTTVVKHIVKTLNDYYKARQLLGIAAQKPQVYFTATTNKAAENLEFSMGGAGQVGSVSTIHSHLRLIMQPHPKIPYKDVLIDRDENQKLNDQLLFIDEASYMNMGTREEPEVFDYLKRKIGKNTKVIFMGDPAQLKAARSNTLPAFDSGFREAALTQIMRQDDDNPIQALSLAMRKAILENLPMPPCNTDGKHIIWLPRNKFDGMILKDMQNPDWTYSTSKFIAYKNKRIQAYNKGITEKITGVRNFQAGDYAVNNQYVKGTRAHGGGIGTDRMVYIERITSGKELDIPGHHVWLDSNNTPFFMPDDHSQIDKMLRKLSKSIAGDGSPQDDELRQNISHVKNTWVDLRPVYGCTAYKSQGSTFRRVYIDLADIGSCYDRDQRMRMLYVALSRAQMQIIMTGDIY